MTWSISRAQAATLHQVILQDQQTPPAYFASGKLGLFNKSVSEEGHTSFSWAREKLVELAINVEERLKVDLTEFMAALSTHHLRADDEPTSGQNCLVM